jgi:signal transduction histidine kinase
VDVRSIVERAADDFRGEVEGRQGRISVRGEFLPIQGDEVLLRQAFSNLCRNAVEACLEAKITPIITIEAAPDHSQRVQRLSFIDNGPGVDPDLAGRVFQPFVTTRARGTGLGLALVQKIVVIHNGRVTMQPEPGGGSRFIVTLPLAGD